MIRESNCWLAVAAGQVLICLAVTSCPVHAREDLWLSITTRSYHADRDAHFNERNWGIGVEYGLAPEWRAIAGTFENSVFRRSNYAGVHWTPWQFGDWRLGGIAGLVNGYPGYQYKYGPILAPVLSWERGRIGVNLIGLPPFGEVAAVVALQVKVRF